MTDDLITPMIVSMAVALLIVGVVVLLKEKGPYRPAISFNEDDIKVMYHIILTKLPREVRTKELADPNQWWFVEWAEENDRCYIYSLNLEGLGLKGELEISGLTRLVRLDCQDNELTSLELSKLPHLTTLNCQNNQLVTLDLSALTKLTDLNCNNNRLISITLPRRWFGPTCLYCSGEGLPMVVLPKWVKLRAFFCQNNPLEAIGLPWQTSLTPLPPPKRSKEEKEAGRTQAL